MRAAITALQDTYVYLTISSGADVRKLARDYNMVLYELEKAAQRADHDKWSELERETHARAAIFARQCESNLPFKI